MVIRTQEFKEACNIILAATQGSQAAVDSNELELRTEGSIMHLRVASPEYSIAVKFNLEQAENFHATVSAALFLKLISQITTEEMTLEVHDTSLQILANGNYKLPLIYNQDKILEVRQICIENPTTQFDVEGEILQSIFTYNSKELLKGTISAAKPSQKYYYIDEEGCITYTTGACINSFHLDKSVKILLTNKIVRLFKLFKDEATVRFTLGYDSSPNGFIQTKVSFETPTISIYAIVPGDDSLINSVPAKALRNRVNVVYPYTVNINRNLLLQAINRLLLFNTTSINYQIENLGTFKFTPEGLQILDLMQINSENIPLSYTSMKDTSYEALLNLPDLKTTLETLNETNVTISFGDSTSFAIKRNNITLLIPQCVIMETDPNGRD